MSERDGWGSGSELAAAFDAASQGTVGVEEELMLMDPETFELAPRAPLVLERLGDDRRFKLELPACQLESVTDPARSVDRIERELAAARRDVAAAVDGTIRLAAAGVHPSSPTSGEINSNPRYEAAARHFGEDVLRRQLVFALQVHVAPGSSSAALGAYNAMRSHLPEIAALCANAPYFGGEDTGLASVRPKVSELLPRQGVPPEIASWDELADELTWGQSSGVIPNPGSWWWEFRPHPDFGTLELRVPDAQTTIREAGAVTALIFCLVTRLTEAVEAGERPVTHPSWRIAENRWLAARDGLEAVFADLDTGRREPVRDRLGRLVADLEETAAGLGCAEELARVRGLIEVNGAIRQREVAAELGVGAVAPWLADCFLEGCGAGE